MNSPLVTAIVSTYNAERFIRGCLEDLVAQTMFEQMEVLVIDSGSLQGEGAICKEFARRYPQIKLLRTEREPFYVALNRAIPMVRGKFLTIANTDDRHSRDFVEIMVATLEANRDMALVYADQFISHTENETFTECETRGAKRRNWPDFTPLDLLLRCITGSQPMWRSGLHGEFGKFDTRYRIAADYDMWLRFAEKYQLLHIPQPLGVFFDSATTMSGASNRLSVNMETLAIQKSRIGREKWRTIPGVRHRLAAEFFGRGYQHIFHDRQPRAAEPFIREAILLDPANWRFLKTYLIRCIAGIK